jgi:hypothetical protein
MLGSQVQAKPAKPVKTKVSLYSHFGKRAGRQSQKFVVIDSIYVDRVVPGQASDFSQVVPELSQKQIGVVKVNGRLSPLVLEGTTIQEFVRDAVTIGFSDSGIEVLRSDHPQVAGNPHIDVTVDTFWLQMTSGMFTARDRYDFTIETTITSSVPGLGKVGVVKGIGYRNSRHQSVGQASANTILYVMKDYFRSFEANVGRPLSVANLQLNERASTKTAVTLANELNKLMLLREQGALSESEYQELRQRAIDSYRTQ